jgi:hypothetical protein
MTTTFHAAQTPSQASACVCHGLQRARTAEVPPNAFALFASILLDDAARDWASCSALAATTGLSNYQARPLLAALVNAGLLERRRRRVPGGPGTPRTTLIDFKLKDACR